VTTKEAIEILVQYNKWRRAQVRIEYPFTATEIGLAIDKAISEMKKKVIPNSIIPKGKKLKK